MASEYLKYLNRDVKPEAPPPPLSPKEKWKNWWYYHWWMVLLAALAVIAVLSLLLKNLGITEPLTDYDVAYVGTQELSEEATAAITAAFQKNGKDATGDGVITVTIHSYLLYPDTKDADSVQLTTASLYALEGDIGSRTSYFFLLEDPAWFTARYQALAAADGSLPAEDDLSWEDKVFLLSDVIPDIPKDAASLYLGRRGYFEEQTIKHREAYDDLWNALIP